MRFLFKPPRCSGREGASSSMYTCDPGDDTTTLTQMKGHQVLCLGGLPRVNSFLPTRLEAS